MTKSVVNALIGILTQQGLLTPSFTAPVGSASFSQRAVSTTWRAFIAA